MALRGDGRGLLSKTIAGLLGFAEPWNYKEFFWGGSDLPCHHGRPGGRMAGCTEGCPGHQNPRKIFISAAWRWDKPFSFFLTGLFICSGIAWKITAVVPGSCEGAGKGDAVVGGVVGRGCCRRGRSSFGEQPTNKVPPMMSPQPHLIPRSPPRAEHRGSRRLRFLRLPINSPLHPSLHF